MNFHHKSGAPVGPTLANELRPRRLSNSKHAVYVRERRLAMTDEQRANETLIKKKSLNKKKAEKCAEKASGRYLVNRKNSHLESRVRHHLSKGRSVADIAVREFILVSKVQAVVDQIAGGAK